MRAHVCQIDEGHCGFGYAGSVALEGPAPERRHAMGTWRNAQWAGFGVDDSAGDAELGRAAIACWMQLELKLSCGLKLKFLDNGPFEGRTAARASPEPP